MSLLVLFNYPGLPQLASDAEASVEFFQVFTTSASAAPIEILATQPVDAAARIEWLSAGREDGGALDEWMLSARFAGGIPGEWLESQIGATIAQLEFIATQRLDRAYPAGWLAAQITNAGVPQEWVESQHGDAPAFAEWLAAQHADIGAPDEFYPSINRQDAGAPTEWLGGQRGDIGTLGEWLSSQRQDGFSPSEWLAAGRLDAAALAGWLFAERQDAGALAEWLLSRARDGGMSIEWIGGVRVQTSDGNAPVEWLSITGAQLSNAPAPAEVLNAAIVNANSLAELALAVRADAGALSSILAGQRGDFASPIDEIATLSLMTMTRSEWLSRTPSDTIAFSELLNSFLGFIQGAPAETLASQRADGMSPSDILSSRAPLAAAVGELLQAQYTDEGVPVDLLVGAAVITSNQAAPVEWLAGGQSGENAALLLEFVATGLASGELVSEILFRQQFEDTTAVHEWLQRGISDSDPLIDWVMRATTSATRDASLLLEIVAAPQTGPGQVVVVKITPAPVSNVLPVSGDLTPKSE